VHSVRSSAKAAVGKPKEGLACSLAKFVFNHAIYCLKAFFGFDKGNIEPFGFYDRWQSHAGIAI
jgi:hypothetical protein